jgi:hypothetical protein
VRLDECDVPRSGESTVTIAVGSSHVCRSSCQVTNVERFGSVYTWPSDTSPKDLIRQLDALWTMHVGNALCLVALISLQNQTRGLKSITLCVCLVSLVASRGVAV